MRARCPARPISWSPERQLPGRQSGTASTGRPMKLSGWVRMPRCARAGTRAPSTVIERIVDQRRDTADARARSARHGGRTARRRRARNVSRKRLRCADRAAAGISAPAISRSRVAGSKASARRRSSGRWRVPPSRRRHQEGGGAGAIDIGQLDRVEPAEMVGDPVDRLEKSRSSVAREPAAKPRHAMSGVRPSIAAEHAPDQQRDRRSWWRTGRCRRSCRRRGTRPPSAARRASA